MADIKLVNHNGKLVPVDAPIFTTANRVFRYGDGLFETIRLINGKMPLFEVHYPRLKRGCELLQLDLSDIDDGFLKDEILKLVKARKIESNARIRMTIYREDGGFYLPLSNKAQFMIEAEEWEEDGFPLNQEGYVVDLFSRVEKPVSAFSNYKTCNSLVYVLAAIHRKEAGVNDCLLINWKARVIESINSNLFIVKKGVLHTPPLAEGCVSGIMREYLLKLLEKVNIPYQESQLSLEELFEADEMFLTNSIQGIRWVKGYKVKIYGNEMAKEISNLLNKELAEYL